jgi:hypothetical protein
VTGRFLAYIFVFLNYIGTICKALGTSPNQHPPSYLQ